VLAGLTIRNPDRHCRPVQRLGAEYHCAADAPPLRSDDQLSSR
jgi:hypothetical protein